MSRRARVKPADVGMGTSEPRRRVQGLRREEVASLAGISIDYYVRLERGNLTGVSEPVLDAIARTLLLSPDERRHLFDLARVMNTPAGAQRVKPNQQIRPKMQLILSGFSGPALVWNDRLDLLAANPLGAALYSPMFAEALTAPNKARFVFLDPRAREFYLNWDEIARSNVAVLRAAAARNPYDKQLSDLIGKLSTRSDDFRRLWADHEVLNHRSGLLRVLHPVVGPVEVSYEAFDLPDNPGVTLIASAAQPRTESAERLQLLGSWSAPAAGPLRSAEDHR